MLVSNTVFKNRYVYNGQTNFPISFPFLDANHVEVWWSAPGGSDLDAQLMDRSTFTIAGVGNPAGGTLTRTGTWQNGITIAIVRNVPITQLHQYTQYDNFPAESHEDALAKLTMICQQQDEVLNRAMTVPVTSDKNPQEYWQDILEQNRIAEEASRRAVDAANKSEACQVKSCDCATRSEAAEGRINATYQEKIDGINTAGQTQTDRVNAAGDTQVNVIVNEGTQQVQRTQAEGLTQEQRVQARGQEQYDRIDTLSTGYINTINSIGTTYVTDINNAGKTNLDQINSTTGTIINQITDTGNFQAARVNTVGNDTVQRVREEANAAVGQADRAKREADRAKEEADRAQHVALGELPVATQVIQGITRLATTEEHLAGENNTIAATPLGVRQMVQQFTSVTIDGPTITGPDNVREGSTHAYAFYAKALLPEAKIAKFIYHFDELNTTAIEAPVPAAQQAAEVTLNVDVTFPGGLGTVNTLIVYAVDSYGNTSKYAMKAVSIRLNEPPVMTGFKHNIPAYVGRFTNYTIRMSGAVDPDGDPITYKFDFGSTGITAVPDNGITDNQDVVITTPKVNHSDSPIPLTFKVLAVDSLGATNEVSITVNVITKFKTPTIGTPVAGQTDFNPKGTITWSAFAIDHDVATPSTVQLEVATDAAFTAKVVDESLTGAVTSWTGVLPYNKQLYVHVRYIASAQNIYSNWSPTVNFTTKVTIPAPTFTVTIDGVVTPSGGTTTKAMVDANKVIVSTPQVTVSPTGELSDRTEYQIADNTNFTNPYASSGSAVTVSGLYRLALEQGKITAGVPAKPTYMRIRKIARNLGPTGNTIDLTSTWSNTYTLNLLSASLTVPVPTSPVDGAIDQNEASVTLMWNNGTAVGQSITRVQVQVYNDITMTTVVKDSGNLAGTTTSWTISGLDLGHEYVWRVRNYGDATGWTEWSTFRTFTTFEYLFTSGITITTPANNAAYVPRKKAITIAWNAPTYRHGDLSLGTPRYNVSILQGTRVVHTAESLNRRVYNVPANTLPAAFTQYTINVVAYFDASKVNNSDKHYVTTGSVKFTTAPAAYKANVIVSGIVTLPTTGWYEIGIIGAGGSGGSAGGSNGGWRSGCTGAGGPPVVRLKPKAPIPKGTQLTFELGAGADNTVGSADGTAGGTTRFGVILGGVSVLITLSPGMGGRYISGSVKGQQYSGLGGVGGSVDIGQAAQVFEVESKTGGNGGQVLFYYEQTTLNYYSAAAGSNVFPIGTGSYRAANPGTAIAGSSVWYPAGSGGGGQVVEASDKSYILKGGGSGGLGAFSYNRPECYGERGADYQKASAGTNAQAYIISTWDE